MSVEPSGRFSVGKGRRLRKDPRVVCGMLRLDGDVLCYGIESVFGGEDIAPSGSGMLSCIEDILTEPTEVAKTQIDQSARCLTETLKLVRHQDTARRESSAY